MRVPSTRNHEQRQRGDSERYQLGNSILPHCPSSTCEDTGTRPLVSITRSLVKNVRGFQDPTKTSISLPGFKVISKFKGLPSGSFQRPLCSGCRELGVQDQHKERYCSSSQESGPKANLSAPQHSQQTAPNNAGFSLWRAIDMPECQA